METGGPRDLRERLVEYSARVVRLVGAMPRTVPGRHVADQLLRSATSVGANYEEAQAAESRNDFVHKMQIALKEVRESHYWLQVIEKGGMLPAGRLGGIIDESTQLRAILSKAVATARGKSKQ